MKGRIGKISINISLIVEKLKEIEEVFSIMRFVPIRAEMMAHKMEIEYIGYSPMFNEIDECEEAPLYEVKAEKDAETDTIINVVARREED